MTASPIKSKWLVCTMLVTVGMMIGYVEHLFIPAFGVPGVKIGLSNLVVVFALMTFGKREAMAVGLAKCLMTGLVISGGMSILYSLAGILFSVWMMALLKAKGYPRLFSIPGISMAGSAMFNIGQILVACLILKNIAPLYYLGFLLAISVVAGGVCGFVTRILMDRLGFR